MQKLKTYNLANLSESERREIELDKLACFMAWKFKKGMVKRAEIVRFINDELPDQERQKFRDLLNDKLDLKKARA